MLGNEDFGGFFCVFAIFHSFFCKNDEKLTCFFGVRAYLIDFCSGGFYFGFGRSNSDSDEPVRGPICFAALRVSSELLLGGDKLVRGPFASRLFVSLTRIFVSHRNYYLVSMA